LLAINKAKSDSHIKGIYIDIDDVSCGISTARSIRNALQDFQKNSGKFVISYYQGEAISQREFYIGSVAKESYAFPTSNFMLTGLGAEVVFFKKLLDKLDVEVQVIRGENNDFKSAVEPFFLTSLSDSARLQNQVMLSGIWKELSNDIAASRKVKTADLNNWIDNMEILNCESALKHRLIDGLLYQDEMMDKLAEKVGEKSPSDIRFADFNSYANTGFYEDQILEDTREELGKCIKDYLVNLEQNEPRMLEKIILIHYNAIKVMMLNDTDFFRLMYKYIPFETNVGRMTLDKFHENYFKP
jgi:protease-4